MRVRRTVGFWLRLGESDLSFDGLKVGRTDSDGVVVGDLEPCGLQPSESKQKKHGVQPSGQMSVPQSIFPSKMRVSALEQYASTRTSLILMYSTRKSSQQQRMYLKNECKRKTYHPSVYDTQFEISKLNGGIDGDSEGLSDESPVGLSERT